MKYILSPIHDTRLFLFTKNAQIFVGCQILPVKEIGRYLSAKQHYSV